MHDEPERSFEATYVLDELFYAIDHFGVKVMQVSELWYYPYVSIEGLPDHRGARAQAS